tara:strand:- start:3658 stop:3882 length:225 start_codon:yes stop_codon:yes gene_type:complete
MPRKFTAKKGGSRKRGGARKTQRRRGGSRRRSGGEKNVFFKTMLDAKKKDLKSFKYKGKTYHKQKKGGLVFYKA